MLPLNEVRIGGAKLCVPTSIVMSVVVKSVETAPMLRPMLSPVAKVPLGPWRPSAEGKPLTIPKVGEPVMTIPVGPLMSRSNVAMSIA